MQSFMRGIPISQVFGTGAGALVGTPIAIPKRTGVSESFVTVQLSFSADPGINVFNLMGSLDDVIYTLIETALISGAGGVNYSKLAKIPCNVNFVRLDQVSKTNVVIPTALLMNEG